MKIRSLILPIISIILVLSLVLTAGCKLTEKPVNGGETSPAPEEEITTVPSANKLLESPPAPLASTSVAPAAVKQVVQSLPSMADVVAEVKPSVVAINVKVPAYDMFGRLRGEQDGAGSGWIISDDGLIITNSHVVADASSISVVLDDGSLFSVDMSTVHTDQFTDLAVMKIDAKGLPAAKIGDAGKLRIGDWVVAIGNSLGQGIRATQGIVCRKEASLDAGQGQTLSGLIETDAAINPGNSGGPLVNMTGEVIGITSAKIAQVGVEGVGYAISINEALPIIRDLMSTGYVVRPWLGVGMYTVDAWAVFRYRLTTDKGVLVTQVVSPGPASTAGLQAGDVIVKFNGQDITESAQLMSAILKAKIGQEVEVVFWRGSNQKTTKAVIAESPKQQ